MPGNRPSCLAVRETPPRDRLHRPWYDAELGKASPSTRRWPGQPPYRASDAVHAWRPGRPIVQRQSSQSMWPRRRGVRSRCWSTSQLGRFFPGRQSYFTVFHKLSKLPFPLQKRGYDRSVTNPQKPPAPQVVELRGPRKIKPFDLDLSTRHLDCAPSRLSPSKAAWKSPRETFPQTRLVQRIS